MYIKSDFKNADFPSEKADAAARIAGSGKYPELYGEVEFFRAAHGTVVVAELFGLPDAGGACAPNIYGFHIHEDGNCSGNMSDSFKNAGMHFDVDNCPHPAHTGDMPPLFAFRGYAWSAFYTERFTPDMVIGRSVIVHSQPDDFTTQPSGNSGDKIGCGVINAVN